MRSLCLLSCPLETVLHISARLSFWKYKSDCTPLWCTVLPCKDLRVPPELALPSLVSLSLGHALRLPATLIPMTSLLAQCLCPCIGSCREHAIQCPPPLNPTFKTQFRCQVLYDFLPDQPRWAPSFLTQTHRPGVFQDPRLHDTLLTPLWVQVSVSLTHVLGTRYLCV